MQRESGAIASISPRRCHHQLTGAGAGAGPGIRYVVNLTGYSAEHNHTSHKWNAGQGFFHVDCLLLRINVGTHDAFQAGISLPNHQHLDIRQCFPVAGRMSTTFGLNVHVRQNLFSRPDPAPWQTAELVLIHCTYVGAPAYSMCPDHRSARIAGAVPIPHTEIFNIVFSLQGSIWSF